MAITVAAYTEQKCSGATET